MKYRNYIIHSKIVVINKLLALICKKLKIKHYSKDDQRGNIQANLR